MIPGSGKPPGEEKGNPLQYSCLGNLMDRGAWWAIVHGVIKNQTQFTDLTAASHSRAYRGDRCQQRHSFAGINLYLDILFCFKGFPVNSDSKESACHAEDPGSNPGSGRSPGEGNDNPLQYSCLENSMDRPWSCKESDTTEQLTL